LRGFFNVCQHRAHRLLEGEGRLGAPAITCPYHAWSYELTGALGLALNSEADWRPFKIEGYLFITLIYFIFCFAMSRYSLWVEKQLNRSKTR